MKLLNETDALAVIGGSSLKGEIGGFTYSRLVEVLGEPTFPEASDDGKVQKEWVFTYGGNVFTIYDWKTYDEEYTTTRLYSWNVGGHSAAYDFILAVTKKLEQ
jgi:hypothetical protein